MVAVVITTKEVDLSLAAVVQMDETTLATALRAEICVGSEVVVAVAVAAKVAAVSRPTRIAILSLIRILECHQTTAAATITRLPSRRRWFQLVVMVLPVVVLAAVVKAPTPPSPMAPVAAVVMEVEEW